MTDNNYPSLIRLGWTEVQIDAFTHSLRTTQSGSERWAKRRATGLADSELREAVSYEYGIYGGSSFPTWYSYKGGANPAFYLGIGCHGTPALTGNALLQAVREVTGVQYPLGDPRNDLQLCLFEVMA